VTHIDIADTYSLVTLVTLGTFIQRFFIIIRALLTRTSIMIFTGIFGAAYTTEPEFKFCGISAFSGTAADAAQPIITPNRLSNAKRCT